MRNFINNLFVVLIVFFISCKAKNEKEKIRNTGKSEINKETSNDKTYSQEVSYIDYRLDSAVYKLDICPIDDLNNYLQDENDMETVLLNQNIYIGDSCFGAYNHNISRALDYARKTQQKSNGYVKISVSILNKNKVFDEVWFWNQPITIGETTNGRYSGKIILDEYYKSVAERGIKISYDYGFDDYYKQTTLNFIREKGKWKIISRESFNTSSENSQHYHIEKTNVYGRYEGKLSDTFPPAEKIEITNEMILWL